MKKLIYLLSFIALIALIGCSGGSDSTIQPNAGDTVKTSSVTFSANFNNDKLNAAFLSDITKINVYYYTQCNIESYANGYDYYGYDSAVEKLPWIAWTYYYDNTTYYGSPDCLDSGIITLDASNPTKTITTFPGYAKFEAEYISDNSTVDRVATAGYLTNGDNNVSINSLRGTWALDTPVTFSLVNAQSLGIYAMPFNSVTKLHIPGYYKYIASSSFDNNTPADWNWYQALPELTLDNGSSILTPIYLNYFTQFKGGTSADANQNVIITYDDPNLFYDNNTNKYTETSIMIMGTDPLDNTSLVPLTYINGNNMTGVITEYVGTIDNLTCQFSPDNGSTWIQVDNISSCDYLRWNINIANTSINTSNSKIKAAVSTFKTNGCDNLTENWTDSWNTELCYDNTTGTISEPSYTATCDSGFHFDTGIQQCVSDSDPNIWGQTYWNYTSYCDSGTLYLWETTIYSETITESINYCSYPFTATRGELNYNPGLIQYFGDPQY